MGIKGLNKWLKSKVPGCFRLINIDKLNGERVAVDTSVYLYKFVCISNSAQNINWLDMFISFCMFFKENNIRPVFVFDGKHPQEKDLTKFDRSTSKLKLQHKITHLDNLIQQLTDNCIIDEVKLSEIQQFIPDAVDCSDDIIHELKQIYNKLNSQCIHITERHSHLLKSFLTHAGFTYLQATTEAEKICSWLCINNYVKGVITADSDVLAYGTPLFIQEFKTGKKECIMIDYTELLDCLGLTREQFIDFCIMCGTDYNTNIPGIGPSKAFDLIKKYQCLEELEGTKFNIDILNYKSARKIFTIFEHPLVEHFDLQKPLQNDRELQLFLIQNNSRFTVDEINSRNTRVSFIIKN